MRLLLGLLTAAALALPVADATAQQRTAKPNWTYLDGADPMSDERIVQASIPGDANSLLVVQCWRNQISLFIEMNALDVWEGENREIEYRIDRKRAQTLTWIRPVNDKTGAVIRGRDARALANDIVRATERALFRSGSRIAWFDLSTDNDKAVRDVLSACRERITR
jgi:hypothetical protein